jgi:hypothetical protein
VAEEQGVGRREREGRGLGLMLSPWEALGAEKVGALEGVSAALAVALPQAAPETEGLCVAELLPRGEADTERVREPEAVGEAVPTTPPSPPPPPP